MSSMFNVGEMRIISQLRAEILCQDRGSLFGENLKGHILAMIQGLGILKTASSAQLPDAFSSNDPQFRGFRVETTPDPNTQRLRGYKFALLSLALRKQNKNG
jgi:hypothetical protein